MTKKNAESWGANLAGQIETELVVPHDMLEQTGAMDFFLQAIKQFVIICMCQKHPANAHILARENWITGMRTMWVISQQPGEYNPLHFHTQCDISAVMYLKVPKMLPTRKTHRPDDGSIVFTSNASRDITLSVPSMVIPPKVGDFFIFGANQLHSVYPYRCEEGQKDVERRSISFNAVYQTPKNPIGPAEKYVQEYQPREKYDNTTRYS